MHGCRELALQLIMCVLACICEYNWAVTSVHVLLSTVHMLFQGFNYVLYLSDEHDRSLFRITR